MELRIDLSDRADIDAAHALLGTLLGITETTSGTPQPITLPANMLDLNGTQDGTLGNVPESLLAGAPSTADAQALPNVPEGLLAGAANENADASQSAAAAPQVPGVPSAPAAPANPANAGVTLDKEGIPHDPRIHSQPPSINKGDGMWRAKKGLNDAALVSRVKAELKALMALPPGATGAATSTTAAPSVAPVAPPAPAAPPAPVAPPAPAAPAAVSEVAPPTTPQELIPRVTSANASGVLPQSALLDACVAYGLPNIPALFQRADKVPEVYAYLMMAYPAFK